MRVEKSGLVTCGRAAWLEVPVGVLALRFERESPGFTVGYLYAWLASCVRAWAGSALAVSVTQRRGTF